MRFSKYPVIMPFASNGTGGDHEKVIEVEVIFVA